MTALVRIVLIDPSHPGNIGSVARAMKNMALSDLVLVRPRAFPHAEADALAAGADDILKIAPIAEANALPEQRVLIYTYVNGRDDFLYQFVWYSNRYAQLAPDLDDLTENLLREDRATVIIDKQSYEKLLPRIAAKNPQILGESQNLICFRI